MNPNDSGALEERMQQLEGELSRIHSQRARQVRTRLWTLAVLLAIPAVAWASTLDIPFSFSNGTIADANQVNANFAAAEIAVDDNASRIAALEARTIQIGSCAWQACKSAPNAGACPAGKVMMGLEMGNFADGVPGPPPNCGGDSNDFGALCCTLTWQ